MVYKPSMGATGPLKDGRGFRQHEELGISRLNGIDTNGYRDTMTLNAGVLGNDQPMATVREFWYSAHLGIDLVSKVDDPQSGRQTFSVTELNTSEPDSHFFAVPDGYKVIEMRRMDEKAK